MGFRGPLCGHIYKIVSQFEYYINVRTIDTSWANGRSLLGMDPTRLRVIRD